MSSIIAYCRDCRKAHAFPRDLAPPVHESNWQIAADTIGGLLLGFGIVAGFVWLVTL